MSWTGFQLNVPAELGQLGETVSSGLSSVRTAMETLRTATQAAIALTQDPTTPSVAAANLAIQAVATALTSLIQSTLSDTAIYLLVVPLPKKGFGRLLGSSNGSGDAETARVRFPTGPLSPTARATAVFEQIMDPDNLFLGGNAHFVRTVSESLFDTGDTNRPKFTRNDKWAYMALISGAADLGSALTLARSLDRVFLTNPNMPATRGATSLTPSAINVRLSAQGTRGVVTWDAIPASRLVESLDRVRITATHYAVIRATDWEFRNTTQVTDVFSTNELTLGMRGQYGAEVVALAPYDGVLNQWTDPTEIPIGGSRYYTIAFKTRSDPSVLDGSTPSQNFGFSTYPNPVEVRRLAQPRTDPARPGRPPDWIRTPSLISLFPPVNGLMDRVIEEINRLAGSSRTVNAQAQSYLAFLQRQINLYTTKIDQFTQYANQIVGITTAAQTLAGSLINFSSGEGPVHTFLEDLMNSFEDPGTGTYPQFLQGTEYTCGAVILAVGPDVSGFEALLGTLFGSSTSNDVAAGVASINQLVATADAAVIAQLAGETPPGADTRGFRNDMTPSASGADVECDPSVG